MEALAGLLQGFFLNRIAWLCLEALRSGPLNVTAVVEGNGSQPSVGFEAPQVLNIAGVVARRPAGSLVYYEVMDQKGLQIHGSSREVMTATRRQQLEVLASIV